MPEEDSIGWVAVDLVAEGLNEGGNYVSASRVRIRAVFAVVLDKSAVDLCRDPLFLVSPMSLVRCLLGTKRETAESLRPTPRRLAGFSAQMRRLVHLQLRSRHVSDES